MGTMEQNNLYQFTSKPNGTERITEFLEDNFISLGWPGIGNLEDVSREELKSRLASVCEYKGQQLVDEVNALSEFVHTMQDGDYVLVADNNKVHLGDVGDYYYVEPSDTPEEGMGHRRGVTWLASIPRVELNAAVQELLEHRDPIVRFNQPFSNSQLDRWISHTKGDVLKTIQVDPETIGEALDILKQAMRSEDADRRERAAIAILQYAK